MPKIVFLITIKHSIVKKISVICCFRIYKSNATEKNDRSVQASARGKDLRILQRSSVSILCKIFTQLWRWTLYFKIENWDLAWDKNERFWLDEIYSVRLGLYILNGDILVRKTYQYVYKGTHALLKKLTRILKKGQCKLTSILSRDSALFR